MPSLSKFCILVSMKLKNNTQNLPSVAFIICTEVKLSERQESSSVSFVFSSKQMSKSEV